MKITKENYEAYVLDHLEGRLDEATEAALFAFLEANPDLPVDLDIDVSLTEIPDPVSFDAGALRAEDGKLPEAVNLLLAKKLEGDSTEELPADPLTQKHWNAMQKTRLPQEMVAMPGKEDLLVPAEIESKQMWFAALAEGDVSGLLADAVMETPEGIREVSLFGKAKLTPEVVAFGDRSGLLQEAKVVAFRSYVYRSLTAVAAALLLALGAWFTFSGDTNTNARVARAESSLNFTRSVAEQSTAPNPEQGGSTDVDQQNHSESIVHFAHQSDYGTSEQSTIETERQSIATVSYVAMREAPVMKTELPSSGIFQLIPTSSSQEQQPISLPEESYAMATPSEAVDWDQFILGRAVDKVLGRKLSPEERMGDALVSKLSEKTDGQLMFAKKDDEGRKGFFLRIGKFSIER